MTDDKPILPAWAERLREGYLSGEAGQFLLHSNVGDLVEWRDDEGAEYITLREFLVRFLARTKDIVVFFNVTEGMSFADEKMRKGFRERINLLRKARGHAEWSGVTPSLPSQALGLLGEFISDTKNHGAVVIDYVETLVPEGDLSYLSSEDRSCLVALQQWSRDPGLLASDNIVIMVAESAAEVNRKIRSQPQVMSIGNGLPAAEERARFIEHCRKKYGVSSPSSEEVAAMTGGLSRIQIESIFKSCKDRGASISLEMVADKKKEVIERECMGLVEVMEPDYGFESVGGLAEVKRILLLVTGSIRQGQTRRVPMGIMLVGPMGTGKSFIAEAFARESGLTCIKLKGFREKWVGSTESNLERVLGIIQALGYVLVIIDEADRNMSTDARSSDSGTESRVMARLKEFMSDTGHRGKILFMLLTNRPDRLDTDLKRPGRMDIRIPLFHPERDEEKAEIMKAAAKRHGFGLSGIDLMEIAGRLENYSPADLEGIMLAADRIASRNGREDITGEDLTEAMEDFIPSRDRSYIEFMEILTVFESSSRKMLPERYQGISDEELQDRIRKLRLRLDV